MSVTPPTGEVAIIFSDVQDSTVLWDRAAGAMQVALDLHDKLMREVIADSGCYEVKTKGDAFMIAAPDATTALRLCFEAQRRLLDCPWPAGILEQPSGAERRNIDGRRTFRGLRVRMGIHVGRPRAKQDPTTGRMDYFGSMVNRAARVAEAAHGGQVLLSEAAFLGLEEGLDAVIEDLGVHRLRGLRREEHLRQAVSPISPLRSFPPLRTSGVRHAALPRDRSAFFGRQGELDAVRKLLHLGPSALVIMAPPGMGKTRFALRFAELHGDDFEGGVWFCDLAASKTMPGLLREVARSLGLTLTGASTEAQLTQLGYAIAGREDALFLFDNVEQVTTPMAKALRVWMRSAPNARFLVTSQRSLAARGVEEYVLEPLDSEACVALFRQRALTVNPDFSVDARIEKRIARLAERLRRVPLAIAMAAARLDVLTLPKLERRLGVRFEKLSTVPKLADEDELTLNQLGDWTWELLPEWARVALRQLAAFVGGFAQDQAENLVDLRDFPDAPPPARALELMVQKSLLYRVMSPERRSHARYGLYGVVRAQAEAALQESGSVDEVMERHAQIFLRLAERLASQSTGPHGVAAVDQLAVELDNILAVHRRFEELRPDWAARAANALMPLLTVRGPLLLAMDLLENGAAAREQLPAAARLEGLGWRCEVRRLVGNGDGARADGEEMLRLAKALGDDKHTAIAWSRLAIIDRDVGDRERAERRLEKALKKAQELSDEGLIARVLNNMAVFQIEKGMPLQAEIYQRRALELFRRVQDHQREWSIWCNLGTMCMDRGDLHEADGHYAQALQLAQGLGHTEARALVLSNMATLYWRFGQRDQAEGLYTKALGLLRESGSRRAEGITLAMLGALTGDKGLEENAMLRLRRAGEVLAELRDPLGAALVALAHAFVDLAQARHAHHEGELMVARQAKARAEKRVTAARRPLPNMPGMASAEDLSDDVRSMMNLLERSFSELPRLKPGVVGGAAAKRRLLPWEEELLKEDTAVDGESLVDDYEA